jgi:uncharacterized protein (DUF1697 family)
MQTLANSSAVPVYIALLRGINVGGARPIKMADLKKTFEKAGATDVATYIQSGNVVFTHAQRSEPKLAAELQIAVEKASGHQGVVVVLRSSAQMAAVVEDNPFPRAKPEQLHVFFMAKKPAADALAQIDVKAFEPERCALVGRELYLMLPNGMGQSKLVPVLARKSPAKSATARNWRTIQTLIAMAT